MSLLYMLKTRALCSIAVNDVIDLGWV